MANYTGCQQKNIVQHPAFFLQFLKAQAEKLMPNSHISFKSWFDNADSEFKFFSFIINVTGAREFSFLMFLKLFLFQAAIPFIFKEKS